MKLTGTDPYSRQTEDGRFSVAKVGVNGTAVYEVWEKVLGRWELRRTNLETTEDALRVIEALS